jgi:hypothetical protein
VSTPLIWIVTAIYAYVSFDQFRQGNVGGAVMFCGYCVANFGILFFVK